MKKIRRPKDITGVGIMMHIAQYFLVQALEILECIMVAPESATPEPIGTRVARARAGVRKALDDLEGEE